MYWTLATPNQELSPRRSVESARADVDEESSLILDIFMVKDVETQRELPQERFSEIQDQILTKLAERRNRMKRSTSLVGNDPRLWEQVGLLTGSVEIA
jgi:hypothetical protein